MFMGVMKNFILSGAQKRRAKYSKEKKTTAAISIPSMMFRAMGYSMLPSSFS